MSIRVLELTLFPTKGYNDIYRRSYNTYIDQNTENQLDEVTQGGTVLNNITVGQIASQVLQPSAQVEQQATIVHGWQTPRYRFILKIEEMGIGGIVNIGFYVGHTEHIEGVMFNGSQNSYFDPNMMFFVNSVNRVRVNTGSVNNSGIKVLQPEQSQQFIYSNGAIANLQTGNMGMYKMRPQDVFQSQSLLNRLRQDNLLEPNTIDTTGAILGIGGDISSRSNNDPTNYLTKMLKAYRYANDHNSDYGSDEEDIYQTAGSVVKEQSIYKNPFMNFMSNHSYNIISSGQFSWKELLSLCPHLDQITKVVLPSQTSNQVMHNHGITLNANMLNSANLWSNENTEHWKGSTNETIAAYMISQALPAMMVEKLIASIRLRITNQTMTGEIQYSVDAVSPIDQIAGLLMPRHVEELVDRLKLETLGTITQGGVIPFDCLIDCSVFGDTFIQISINGGPHTPLLMPTFADSAASPVITTSVDNYNKVSNDVVNLARKLIGGNGYQQNVHSGVVVPNQQAPIYSNQPAQPIVQSNGQPFSDSLYN